jgi:dihydroxy-acid dehydratase
VTDGIAMGTARACAPRWPRARLIADSIELAVRGHCLDGWWCCVGCDKTIPAAAMALARLDMPERLMLYGGTILPGTHKDGQPHHDPGRVRSRRRARRRQDRRRRAEGDREPPPAPAPAPAAASSPPTPWRWRLTILGLSPMGLNDIPAP